MCALSTRIFALISLVRLACKREKQTEKERENDRVKRGLYICICVKKEKRMKRKTLIKSSIRVRLKRKLLKNIILLIATKVEIYAVLP